MDVNERATMLQTQNVAFANQKKKIEAELISVRNEVHEALKEAEEGHDAARKALTTSALLCEDLKKEKDQAEHLERMKKNQEANIKSLQKRLDEAEEMTSRGGKKYIFKMKQKYADLQSEYEDELGRSAETTKQTRKLERKLKGTIYQISEDKKILANLNKNADKDKFKTEKKNLKFFLDFFEFFFFEFIKLTEKIRGYKKQVEETTDNANQAMTKYKKLANDLDNWNERAEMAEDAVKQARNKAKQLVNF